MCKGMCTHVYSRIFMQACMNISIQICIYIYIYIYILTRTCSYSVLLASEKKGICIFLLYIYIYIYIYIHMQLRRSARIGKKRYLHCRKHVQAGAGGDVYGICMHVYLCMCDVCNVCTHVYGVCTDIRILQKACSCRC